MAGYTDTIQYNLIVIPILVNSVSGLTFLTRIWPFGKA